MLILVLVWVLEHFFSMKNVGKPCGGLLRWDYGVLHVTQRVGTHSTFRATIFGKKIRAEQVAIPGVVLIHLGNISMVALNKNLEAYRYNLCHISIKDLFNDLDIGDSKWDDLFNFILESTSNFYFLGDRLQYGESRVEDMANYLSDKMFFIDAKYYSVFFKINDRNLLISRRNLASLWECYEYPAIFFMTNQVAEKELLELLQRKATYQEIAESISGLYFIYAGFETNVLWLWKSQDMKRVV